MNLTMSDNDIHEFKPTFLDKEAAESTPYPGCDEKPTFDEELSEEKTPRDPSIPVAGVRTRYSEIARLHALCLTNNQICERLGYRPAIISGAVRHPFVGAEIKRLREQIFDKTAIEVLRDVSMDGVKLIHSVILDEREKMGYRLDAAKWAKEQAHGKAHQSLSVESNTLNVY